MEFRVMVYVNLSSNIIYTCYQFWSNLDEGFDFFISNIILTLVSVLVINFDRI